MRSLSGICTPGLWQYVPVRTGTYHLVLFLVRTFGNFSHDVTNLYVPVRTGIEKCQKNRTSTYKYVLFMVYHGAWQYMTVNCSTWWYIALMIAVHIPAHTSTYSYVLVRLGTKCMSVMLDLRRQFWCSARPLLAGKSLAAVVEVKTVAGQEDRTTIFRIARCQRCLSICKPK